MRRLRGMCCGLMMAFVPVLLGLPARGALQAATPHAVTVVCTATATPVGVTLDVHFVAQITGCSICYPSWDFGDYSGDTVLDVIHTYGSPGTYYWTFQALDEAAIPQCTETGSVTVPNCTVTCTATVPATAQVGQPVSFKGTYGGTCPGTVGYLWGFGNGVTSTEQNPTYAYPMARTDPYMWTLTVSLDGGGRENQCYTYGYITITEAACTLSCSASASPATGQAPLSVQFTGSATPSSACSGTVAYDWDFGDGSPHGTAQSPSHTYATANTYAWTMVASVGATQCSKTGTIVATGVLAALSGTVVFTDGQTTYRLAGPDIQNGFVIASQHGQEVGRTPISNGAFAFADDALPDGAYDLTAAFTYVDHITVDAYNPTSGDYGCAAPAGGSILKSVVSAPVSASVPSTQSVAVTFPPPIVMLHGLLECYKKFYSSDPSDTTFWDNDARSRGFLSFTPNYGWWGSEAWSHRATDVMGQVAQDLEGLTGSSASEALRNEAPWALVGFDMGGLVARAITYELQYDDDYKALVKSLGPIYLLGTPNSGSDLLAGGGAGPLAVQEIVLHFNADFPDFGGKNSAVYAIAGDDGWWNLLDNDGRVSLTSAFVIEQLGCSDSATNPACIPYASKILYSGTGHVFFHTHYELGSPETRQDILEGIVLPGVSGFAAAFASGEESGMPIKPKSPGGSTMWGTTGRTTGTVTDTLSSLSAESGTQTYPFDISPTDGMAVLIYVKSGSATFKVVPPGQAASASPAVSSPCGARPEDEPGYTFFEVNPACGTWTLQVTPGASGVSFTAVFVEDGTFGILGYPVQDHYAPGAQSILRVDLTGDLTGVAITAAAAKVYDPVTGQLLATVPLYDDGNHGDGAPGDGSYGGYYTVPSAPGAYPVVFGAKGTYAGSGCEFSRIVFGTLNVIPITHLFTGHFADTPVYLSSGTLYDGLLFKPTISFQGAGDYLVTASLYDSKGNYIDTATDALGMASTGSADATLRFSLGKSYCSQYGKPFTVGDLEIDSAATMQPLDVWGSDVATATYSSSGFVCQSGTPGPMLKAVHPDEGALGQSLTVTVGGHGFKDGATLSIDGGVSVSQSAVINRNVLVARLSVPDSAQVGARTATVTNTDGTSATLPAAFTVHQDDPPTVKVQTPLDGSTISGDSLKCCASASDDIVVTKVAFYVDSGDISQLTLFPFIATLDVSSLSNGAHRITARAYDDKGLYTEDSVIVFKNPPTISTVASAGNPFRLKIGGANFEAGAQVFFGNDTTPWPTSAVKSASLIVAKKGAALKARFPSGVPVTIKVKNPDGGTCTGSYTRPQKNVSR